MNMATLSTLAKLDPATDPYPTEPAIDRHPQLNQAANWAEAESLILVTDGDPNSSQYGRYVLLPNWIPEAQQHKVAKHLRPRAKLGQASRQFRVLHPPHNRHRPSGNVRRIR